MEKEAIASKLSNFLKAFKTDDLSQDITDVEVEAVRQELYEKSEFDKATLQLLPLKPPSAAKYKSLLSH